MLINDKCLDEKQMVLSLAQVLVEE